MRKILILSSILFVIYSCQKINDAPKINSLIISNTNIQKEEGAVFEFMYDFSDDTGLNQFRVSILDNFVDARLVSAPWNYEMDYDLSGLSVIDTMQINLPYPDLEPGRYELTITLQDINSEETTVNNNDEHPHIQSEDSYDIKKERKKAFQNKHNINKENKSKKDNQNDSFGKSFTKMIKKHKYTTLIVSLILLSKN